MPTATPEQLEPTYHGQWDAAKVLPAWEGQAKAVAKKIFANKAVYQKITAQSGVPYWWIGPTHDRESGLNFKTHLHNGDPLTKRTTHVPSGRPATGSAPFAFEASALDALKMAPHKLDKVKRWSVERSCYEWERYNGFGYLAKGPSPYVWSGTDQYKHGKFIADGVYRDGTVDKQLGTVAIARELALLDPDVAQAFKDREPGPPPDVIDKETKNARSSRTAGGVVAGGGVAGEVTNKGTQQPDTPAYFSPALTMTAIGVGIAVVILFTILISRKVALINSKWSQS